MALPDFTMRGLLEAGAHFGHQSHRWNPKMAPFIFGARNNIHIIDLAQTVPLLHQALKAVSDTVAKGGRVLFVGTKRQAQEQIADAAKRSAQYYINSRWLGGMLTNWKTISGSIQRLRKLDEHARRRRVRPHQERAPDAVARARQAREGARRHQGHGRHAGPDLRHRHEQGAAGDQGGEPPRRFRSSPSSTPIAIRTASPIPIPGNDDAGRAIALYCDLIASAAIDGISRSQGSVGIDIGAAEAPEVEPAVERPGDPRRSAPAEEIAASADVEAPARPSSC